MREILCREGALQAAVAHSERNCVHVNILGIWLCFTQLLCCCIRIFKDGQPYVDRAASSTGYCIGMGQKSRMRGHMVIIDVKTFSNWTIDYLLIAFYADKWNYWDSECEARFGREDTVLVSDGVHYLIEITTGVIGLLWNHLEHPRAIF